jgi:5-methylcytosine-specific restriction endonuclease McrA
MDIDDEARDEKRAIRSVHLLDPRKVAQVLGVPYHTLQRRGQDIPAAPSYWFVLGPADGSVFLSFDDREPDLIQLSSRLSEPAGLSLFFYAITRVAYDDERHELILESHTPSHFTVLKIRSTGFIDVTTGLDEMNYEGTGYDERYRALTEPDQRLRLLHTMPYQEYLLTPEWQERRKAQLERADYRCQVCNTGKSKLHVHHRTYERRGNEAPGDLLVLCRECHELFHQAGKLVEEDRGPGDTSA